MMMMTINPHEAGGEKENTKRVAVRKRDHTNLVSTQLSSIYLLTHQMLLMRTKSINARHVMGALL